MCDHTLLFGYDSMQSRVQTTATYKCISHWAVCARAFYFARTSVGRMSGFLFLSAIWPAARLQRRILAPLPVLENARAVRSGLLNFTACVCIGLKQQTKTALALVQHDRIGSHIHISIGASHSTKSTSWCSCFTIKRIWIGIKDCALHAIVVARARTRN